jgi:hypothetical protein
MRYLIEYDIKRKAYIIYDYVDKKGEWVPVERGSLPYFKYNISTSVMDYIISKNKKLLKERSL